MTEKTIKGTWTSNGGLRFWILKEFRVFGTYNKTNHVIDRGAEVTLL